MLHLGRLQPFSQTCKARLEKLASDKHLSLLRTIVNYGRKKVYNTGPRPGQSFQLKMWTCLSMPYNYIKAKRAYLRVENSAPAPLKVSNESNFLNLETFPAKNVK
jgi:hypothetical protein